MPDLEFWSENCRCGMRIAEEHLSAVLRQCVRSGRRETGGILAGDYTEALDYAVVRDITGAPPDSRCGQTWFHRGIRGLQGWLNHLWSRSRVYYLGEWHYHPDNPAYPSDVDTSQVRRIAQSERYHCPEPLLLIIGKDAAGAWEARTYIFPRGKSLVELQPNDRYVLDDLIDGLNP